MKIYGPKDRVSVSLKKEGEETITFILAPLSAKHKGEVMGALSMKGGEGVQDKWQMVNTALRYALKGIDGIEDGEGNAVALKTGADGGLDEASMDLVLNLGPQLDIAYTAALQLATSSLSRGLINPNTGNPFDDVEVVINPKKA